MKNQYDLEDRLVKFAGDVILYTKSLPNEKGGKTIEDQIIRPSISSALNYGEVQGTNTDKDFIHKMSIVLKELKETRVGLKICIYTNFGNLLLLENLLKECNELVAISATIIKNKENKISNKN